MDPSYYSIFSGEDWQDLTGTDGTHDSENLLLQMIYKERMDALEDGDHDEVSSWLAYWITFAAFTLLEGASAKLMSWLPFYYVMRLALIMWLFLPATRGAQALYRWAVAPVLRRYRPQVDAALARWESQKR
ncbi:unnamed protein product [Cladocopium goreaui]|uniref:Protein YOP1 n=1 Tax=Cladocopium goreaui TaxID=2562237 RepID=A0A9P1DEM5_9DINO|nr:unnamed protein product [Cladocopium goreaui]